MATQDVKEAVNTIFDCEYSSLVSITETNLDKVIGIYMSQTDDWKKGVDDVMYALIGMTMTEFIREVDIYLEIGEGM